MKNIAVGIVLTIASVVLFCCLTRIRQTNTLRHSQRSFGIVNVNSAKVLRRASEISNTNNTRGLVMCAGERHIRYLKRNVFQLRHVWDSQLPVVIAHCREMSAQDEQTMRDFDPRVEFLDLCEEEPVFGLSLAEAQSVLRGFYCKIGALLKSPYPETMLTDVDVVWFSKPDSLFSSPGYASTGSLFMRERMYLHKGAAQSYDANFSPAQLMSYFESVGLSADRLSAAKALNSNGVSLFWQAAAGGVDPKTGQGQYLSGYQDSSVVLVDKRRHPGMLRVLGEYLRTNFQMGYGDKELFWISATVAGEEFAFEPYIGGQYRDCYGLLVHFDPTDTSGSPSAIYVNGEFVVERKSESMSQYTRELNVVGEYLESVVTRPILAQANMSLVDMDTWRTKPPNTGCTCRGTKAGGGVLECGRPSTSVNDLLLLAQWLTYTSTLDPKKDYRDNCVPVYLSMAMQLSSVLERVVSDTGRNSDLCSFIGCPILPIIVDESLPWHKDTRDVSFCEPVYFQDNHTAFPEAMRKAATAARSPFSEWNRPTIPVGNTVACSDCGSKSVYLMKSDGKLHFIPSLAVFYSLGLDFGDTHYLARRQFDNFEIGEPL